MTLGSIDIAIDLPNLILMILIVIMIFVLYRAQSRTDFDLGNMLKDEDNKESPLRLATLGAFAVSTWIVIKMTIQSTITVDYFLYYLACWSGAKVIETVVRLWASRGNVPPPVQLDSQGKVTS